MLMYGSNFWMVTLKPRESNKRAMDDEMMPLPKDDTTPPVTKIYLVSTILKILIQAAKVQISFQLSVVSCQFFVEFRPEYFDSRFKWACATTP